MAVSTPLVALINRRYDRIITAALDFHEELPPLVPPKPGRRGRKKRRTGHNLALRLRDRKEGTLRFLTDPDVPFTNNEAERDLRMMNYVRKYREGSGLNKVQRILRPCAASSQRRENKDGTIIETLMMPADQIIATLKYA